MSQTTQNQASDEVDLLAGRRNGPLLVVAGAAALLFAAAGALWVHYGTAVFFETIRAGFAACFG